MTDHQDGTFSRPEAALTQTAATCLYHAEHPMRFVHVFAGLLCAALSAPAAAQGVAELSFSEPEHFTDLVAPTGTIGETDPALMAELRERLMAVMSARLRDGQKLAVAITNVDLAGRMELLGMKDGRWLATPQQLRIYRPDTPPRISVQYALIENDAVIAHGTEDLSDPDWGTQAAVLPETGSLDPVTDLFERWLVSLLGQPL